MAPSLKVGRMAGVEVVLGWGGGAAGYRRGPKGLHLGSATSVSLLAVSTQHFVSLS